MGEEEIGGFGGSLVEVDAFGGGGDFGAGGKRFAVDDHELGAMVARGEMEHANAGGVFGEGEVVLRHESGERCAIRFRIAELFGVVAEERFDVIVEREAADVGIAGELVVVGVLAAGRIPRMRRPPSWRSVLGGAAKQSSIVGM